MSETVEVDGLQADPATGEVQEEPTEIERMIAATMGDDGEPEGSEQALEGGFCGDESKHDPHVWEQGDKRYQCGGVPLFNNPELDDDERELTQEDYERQQAEAAAMRASMKAQEKAFKARDTRVDTYTKYMEGWATEQEQPLVRCPLCLPETPGFIFHPEQVPLNQDQLNVCNILSGNPLMPDFQAIPQAQTCPACKGEGRVLTGSKVTNKTTIECLECKGSGWVGEAKNVRPEVAAAPQYVQPNEDGLPPEELPKLDPWGTPEWDGDYMRMPQARTPGWDNGTGVWVHPDQRAS